METKYKMVSYHALNQALTRDEVNQPGKVATLLLTTFLVGNGKITMAECVKSGLCKEGQFNVWRNKLVELNWLDFDVAEAAKHKDWQTHKMGKKLFKYVNQERQSMGELITMRDLNIRLKRERLIMLKLAIGEYDPPVTQEKLDALLKKADSLEKEVIASEKELFE